MMEKSPSSVKSNLTQVQQNGPHQGLDNDTQGLLSLWDSHQKLGKGPLDEKGDTPRVKGVTESQNNPQKKFSWNPLRKVEESDDGSLGKTKRFSKVSFSTAYPTDYPKPVKGKGMLTYRIKKSQLGSGLTFTKRCKYCLKSGHDKTHIDLYQLNGNQVKKKGVQVCGNVWECASCRPYLQWKMREEIKKVQSYSKDNGESQFMMTLTVNHNKKESLLDNVNLINDGWNSLRNHPKYISLMSRLENTWTMRTIEVTYGKRSGFHPHFHLLLSGHHQVSDLIQEIKEVVTEVWGRVISKLRNNKTITNSTVFDRWTNENTVVVSEVNDLASDYFVKWSMKDEMTSGLSSKEGKNGNYSIGDLEVLMTKQYESTGQVEPWIREVLTEFYTTMKRRKYNTKTDKYREYLAAIEDQGEQTKSETEIDEDHNNITGHVQVKEWFWDNILHKYGIVFDLIGEVKNREPGEDFLEIRSWLLWELWKVMPIPISNLECLLDTNLFIETIEGKNKTGVDEGFWCFQKRKETTENEYRPL